MTAAKTAKKTSGSKKSASAAKPSSGKKILWDVSSECKFGNLSVGAEKAAIVVTIDRSIVAIDRLEPLVVGGYLNAILQFDPQSRRDVVGQQKLVETTSELRSVVECQSLMVKPEKLTFRLLFLASSIDIQQIAALAQTTGQIKLTRIGDSSDTGDGGDSGELDNE